jgi:hypothetical protein
MKKVLMKSLLATSAMVAICTWGQAAHALATCPHTAFTNPLTTPPNCNLVIDFNADGSITTSIPVGATPNYDGSEDALIGVFNHTGGTISSFNIQGTGIFSLMDGDGINTLTFATNSAAGMSDPVLAGKGADAYGGEDAFFTSVNLATDSGTVNFKNGIAPNASDYFSLEEQIDVSHPPVITAAPEPASMALLGVALGGLGMVRRRRR